MSDDDRLLRRLGRHGGAHILGIAVAFVAYSLLRALVEGTHAEAVDNAELIVELERALSVDWERAAQAWVLDRPPWMQFWNFVYRWLLWGSVLAFLLVLWFRDRRRYALLVATLLISAAMGLAIWALFPVAPPRFVGYVDTLARSGDRVMDERTAWINRYAAVPSFHVGWPAVAGYVAAAGSRSVWKWLVSLGPAVLIAFAVVFTGNHFVVDAVAGILVVAVAVVIGRRAGTFRRRLVGDEPAEVRERRPDQVAASTAGDPVGSSSES